MSECDREPVTVVVGLLEPLVGRGLVDVLRQNKSLDVLASSDLREGAVEDLVATHRPHVVVLGEAVNYCVLARLKASRPAPGVLIIARDPPPLSVTALAAVGVLCLAQSAPIADILDAVRRAARGAVLTPREAEVLALLLRKDRPYGMIALEMRISVATVRTHARAIFQKLGVKTRRELVGRLLPDGPGSASM